VRFVRSTSAELESSGKRLATAQAGIDILEGREISSMERETGPRHQVAVGAMMLANKGGVTGEEIVWLC
jgi:hypothetical protein